MTMHGSQTQLNFKLSQDLHAKLKAMAKFNGTSVSATARMILLAYLRQNSRDG